MLIAEFEFYILVRSWDVIYYVLMESPNGEELTHMVLSIYLLRNAPYMEYNKFGWLSW